MPGSRSFKMATSCGSKASSLSCSTGTPLAVRILSIGSIISGPLFSSMKSFLPTGSWSSTSSSDGIRSPCQSPFHLPTSSCFNSSKKASDARMSNLAVRQVVASCRQTTRPSFVRRKSASMPSAPCSQARRKAASVFSGASCEAPRWAISRVGLVPSVPGIKSLYLICIALQQRFPAQLESRGYQPFLYTPVCPAGMHPSDAGIAGEVRQLRGDPLQKRLFNLAAFKDRVIRSIQPQSAGQPEPFGVIQYQQGSQIRTSISHDHGLFKQPVCSECHFQVGRCYLFTIGQDNDLLQPAGDGDVAAVGDSCLIAGMQPSLAVYGRFSGFGIAPVA